MLTSSQITALHRGQRTVQREVYDQHCDRLMAVVRRYVRPVHQAEEVLQDTFLQIFTKIDTFDPQRGKFESWSHQIAVNEALQYLRRTRQLPLRAVELQEAYATVESKAIDRLAQEELEGLLAGLDPRQAMVFRLKVLEGYSHREITEMLQLSTVANSRKLLSFVKNHLRQLWRKDAKE